MRVRGEAAVAAAPLAPGGLIRVRGEAVAAAPLAPGGLMRVRGKAVAAAPLMVPGGLMRVRGEAVAAAPLAPGGLLRVRGEAAVEMEADSTWALVPPSTASPGPFIRTVLAMAHNHFVPSTPPSTLSTISTQTAAASCSLLPSSSAVLQAQD
ncbi:hypothetical protein CEUSTIGMA_g14096.t1 [Chlamydomonas eustigma]|uniref:Uncharacterized protein n=1 Tax=Chlamydomonas eustigma TaxID=1157962 RepID=A0A250XUK1_9CHLO|nr:hypothetical protein CEUSTIGMA_g14096.t1 [Chlamydomonas eustigma]|eukprot:GAX86689.1 hypothetical protein CEUSTIGMA_g14096.t1 [Chlamydomonas eustigma]